MKNPFLASSDEEEDAQESTANFSAKTRTTDLFGESSSPRPTEVAITGKSCNLFDDEYSPPSGKIVSTGKPSTLFDDDEGDQLPLTKGFSTVKSPNLFDDDDQPPPPPQVIPTVNSASLFDEDDQPPPPSQVISTVKSAKLFDDGDDDDKSLPPPPLPIVANSSSLFDDEEEVHPPEETNAPSSPTDTASNIQSLFQPTITYQDSILPSTTPPCESLTHSVLSSTPQSLHSATHPPIQFHVQSETDPETGCEPEPTHLPAEVASSKLEVPHPHQNPLVHQASAAPAPALNSIFQAVDLLGQPKEDPSDGSLLLHHDEVSDTSLAGEAVSLSPPNEISLSPPPAPPTQFEDPVGLPASPSPPPLHSEYIPIRNEDSGSRHIPGSVTGSESPPLPGSTSSQPSSTPVSTSDLTSLLNDIPPVEPFQTPTRPPPPSSTARSLTPQPPTADLQSDAAQGFLHTPAGKASPVPLTPPASDVLPLSSILDATDNLGPLSSTVSPITSTITRPSPPSARRAKISAPKPEEATSPVSALSPPVSSALVNDPPPPVDSTAGASEASDLLTSKLDLTTQVRPAASTVRRPAPPGGRRRIIPGSGMPQRPKPEGPGNVSLVGSGSGSGSDQNSDPTDEDAVSNKLASRLKPVDYTHACHQSSLPEEVYGSQVESGSSRWGVKITAECLQSFYALRTRRQYSFVTFKLSEDLSEISLGDTGCPSDATESCHPALLAALPSTQPRYAVYDLPYTNADNCQFSKLVFILWVPDESPVRSKMIYAGSKEFFKSKLEGLAADIQATEYSDVSEVALQERLQESLTRK